MRKHDHGQIPQSNLNKMKLKTRGLFKRSLKSSHLNCSQENKGGITSRSDLISSNLDMENSSLNGDEEALRCSSKEMARSVEDDDEIEDYDDEDEDDEEDEDMDEDEDEDYEEEENEELTKSVENKKILIPST